MRGHSSSGIPCSQGSPGTPRSCRG
jgi:hypothetical protein